jgi:iron complex outermembrane receptor protein
MIGKTLRSRRTRLLAQATACSALWVIATAANAQDTLTTQPPEPDSRVRAQSDASTTAENSGDIADIIVTAQRREERLQNVPIAITAVTGAQLAQHGVNNTQQLSAAVPGLTIQTSAGYLQPRVRGIGNNAVGAGFEGGVAVYVDGIYQASPAANLFSLANIERIEVLKGPQGTLFGRNTTGGLIHIITSQPSDTFGGHVDLTAANYQDFVGDLYLTGPLARGVAMNFAGHVEFQGNGWGTNQFYGSDAYRMYHDIALRSTIRLEPSDRTRISITGDYENTNSNQNSSQAIVTGTGFPFPIIRPTGNAWNINLNTMGVGKKHGWGVSGNLTQDLGFARLTSLTGYRHSWYNLRFDGDATNLSIVEINNIQVDQQFSQELQLASNPDSKVSWVIGAFYFDASSRFAPAFVTLTNQFSLVTRADLGTRSLAAYAQATIPIADATNLTLGARYTHERKDITDITQQITLLPAGIATPIVNVPSQSTTFNRPTWRISLDHRFSPEVMVFASYNRGFKSGGFNGQVPAAAAFLPERLDAYEVGVKTDLLDRHLRINASGFMYNYRDIQVTRFVTGQQLYYNGAAARVYGLDIDAEARPIENLTLTAGIVLLHDRFTNFPNATISTQGPFGPVITSGSATGNRLPLTSDFSATLGAVYRVPTTFGNVTLDASYSYNDGFFAQPDNILRQPAYNLLGFGAAVNFNNGLTARAWVRNATNEKIYVAIAAGSLQSVSAIAPPRTYGLTVGIDF